jgi:hypothetical protein
MAFEHVVDGVTWDDPATDVVAAAATVDPRVPDADDPSSELPQPTVTASASAANANVTHREPMIPTSLSRAPCSARTKAEP